MTQVNNILQTFAANNINNNTDGGDEEADDTELEIDSLFYARPIFLDYPELLRRRRQDDEDEEATPDGDGPAAWLEKAWQCKRLSEASIRDLCAKVKEVLAKEATVVSVPAPVTVAGDVHGQFHDLAKLFAVGGSVPDTRYLFLGDYVDRGLHGVEVITLLFLLKVLHPDRIFLLRGNHETRAQTHVFGFYDECMLKYRSSAVWSAFMDAFDCLPIAALVDGRLFCMHGGLSPAAPTLDAVRAADRFSEVPGEGPLADLVWSDPEDSHAGWQDNERGAGYTFGQDVVEAWNERNGTEGLVRGHQMFMEGYHWHHNGRTLTVFSAPNYVYRAGNKAGLLRVGEAPAGGLATMQFEHAAYDDTEQDEAEKTVPTFFY